MLHRIVLRLLWACLLLWGVVLRLILLRLIRGILDGLRAVLVSDKSNIVRKHVHAVVLHTVLVCVVIVPQLAGYLDSTALVEIAADKLRRVPPAADVDEIRFPFAGLLVGEATIDCHAEPAESNATWCLPQF